MRYYLDTSIWMDYYEERKDSVNDLGEFAFQLLFRVLASGNKIIVSTLILSELENNYSLGHIRAMTLPFESILDKVSVSQKQMDEAHQIARSRKLPPSDAIHAILARDHSAILVTRDKHFQSLRDICKVVKPEEIV